MPKILRKLNNKSGFTIVELLVVIVVIGILAAITMVSYSGITQKAKAAVLQSDLRNAATILEQDKIIKGTYPATESAANDGKGLPKSSGTDFQYTYTPGTDSYNLKATNGDLSYLITSSDNVPTLVVSGGSPAETSFMVAWGSINAESPRKIIQTNDGGYVVAGEIIGYSDGNYDAFLAKFTSDGTLSWAKTWGGTGFDTANSLSQATDGGYYITGQTSSYGSSGSNDAFVAKFTSDGTLSWNKTWGGDLYENVISITGTSDGGCAIAGFTQSYSAVAYDMDAFVAKFTSDGTLSWNKTWGGTSSDTAYSIAQTADNGYIIAGETNSYGAGSSDAFVAKFTSDGTLSWNKTWGGTSYDNINSIIQTADNGYVAIGATDSYGAGGRDTVLTKFTSDGTLSWNKTWGGTSDDTSGSVLQTASGDYIIAGSTDSYGYGNGETISHDIFASKFTSSGTLSWSKTWGGTGSDIGDSITKTSDSGFAIAGETLSYGSGGWDALILKFKSDGSLDGCLAPMCTSPTATSSSPTATSTSPTGVTSTSPVATVTTPSVTVATPSGTLTTITTP